MRILKSISWYLGVVATMYFIAAACLVRYYLALTTAPALPAGKSAIKKISLAHQESTYLLLFHFVPTFLFPAAIFNRLVEHAILNDHPLLASRFLSQANTLQGYAHMLKAPKLTTMSEALLLASSKMTEKRSAAQQMASNKWLRPADRTKLSTAIQQQAEQYANLLTLLLQHFANHSQQQIDFIVRSITHIQTLDPSWQQSVSRYFKNSQELQGFVSKSILTRLSMIRNLLTQLCKMVPIMTDDVSLRIDNLENYQLNTRAIEIKLNRTTLNAQFAEKFYLVYAVLGAACSTTYNYHVPNIPKAVRNLHTQFVLAEAKILEKLSTLPTDQQNEFNAVANRYNMSTRVPRLPSQMIAAAPNSARDRVLANAIESNSAAHIASQPIEPDVVLAPPANRLGAATVLVTPTRAEANHQQTANKSPTADSRLTRHWLSDSPTSDSDSSAGFWESEPTDSTPTTLDPALHCSTIYFGQGADIDFGGYTNRLIINLSRTLNRTEPGHRCQLYIVGSAAKPGTDKTPIADIDLELVAERAKAVEINTRILTELSKTPDVSITYTEMGSDCGETYWLCKFNYDGKSFDLRLLVTEHAIDEHLDTLMRRRRITTRAYRVELDLNSVARKKPCNLFYLGEVQVRDFTQMPVAHSFSPEDLAYFLYDQCDAKLTSWTNAARFDACYQNLLRNSEHALLRQQAAAIVICRYLHRNPMAIMQTLTQDNWLGLGNTSMQIYKSIMDHAYGKAMQTLLANLGETLQTVDPSNPRFVASRHKRYISSIVYSLLILAPLIQSGQRNVEQMSSLTWVQKIPSLLPILALFFDPAGTLMQDPASKRAMQVAKDFLRTQQAALLDFSQSIAATSHSRVRPATLLSTGSIKVDDAASSATSIP